MGPTAGAPATGAVAHRRARTLSLGLLALVGGLALVPEALTGPLAWTVLAIGLLIGLPHGAVDHLVPEWTLGRDVGRTTFVAILVAYSAVAALAFAFLLVAPVAAAALFLVVSVLHFGAGDVEFLDAAGALTRWQRPLAVLAFGLPPVALPIAVHAGQARPVLVGLAGELVVLTAPTVRLAGLVATLALVTVTAWLLARQGRPRVALDLAVLVVAFVLAPPLLAFAAYFGGWHATRHIARLLELDPRNAGDLAAGRLGRPLARFARSALLPTLASVVVLLGLWWGAGGVEGLVAAHLGLLVALTMPHVAVVSWLDRRRSTDIDADATATVTEVRA